MQPTARQQILQLLIEADGEGRTAYFLTHNLTTSVESGRAALRKLISEGILDTTFVGQRRLFVGSPGYDLEATLDYDINRADHSLSARSREQILQRLRAAAPKPIRRAELLKGLAISNGYKLLEQMVVTEEVMIRWDPAGGGWFCLLPAVQES